nr:hypothetical protein [Tanacetum cinerariifolium]
NSLSPNGVSVGDVVETIASSEGVGLPLTIVSDGFVFRFEESIHPYAHQSELDWSLRNTSRELRELGGLVQNLRPQSRLEN